MGEAGPVTAQRRCVWTTHLSRNIRVFSHDSDPATDSPLFRISRDDAARRLSAGYVIWLDPRSVRLKPPPDYIAKIRHTGLFSETWRPRLSDCYLVWQFVPLGSRPPQQEEIKKPAEDGGPKSSM